MDWLYYILFLIIAIAGLVLNVLGLPGLWLLLLGAIIYAWVTGFDYVGKWTIGALFILAVIAEITETMAGAVGAKRFGASKKAMFAAIVGGIVGSIAGSIFIPVPIVGTLVGMAVGSFAAAAGVERLIDDNNVRALKIGTGAAIGRLGGVLIKSGFGIAMLLVAMVMAFPVSCQRAASIAPTTVPTTAPTTAPATLPTTLP